jgi:hypothetical protein
MSLTYKQVECALPFDLYEKIVRMKLENERKADPAGDILCRFRIDFWLNHKRNLDLTPKDYIYLKNHLFYSKVTFKSFRNIVDMLHIMKAPSQNAPRILF